MTRSFLKIVLAGTLLAIAIRMGNLWGALGVPTLFGQPSWLVALVVPPAAWLMWWGLNEPLRAIWQAVVAEAYKYAEDVIGIARGIAKGERWTKGSRFVALLVAAFVGTLGWIAFQSPWGGVAILLLVPPLALFVRLLVAAGRGFAEWLREENLPNAG